MNLTIHCSEFATIGNTKVTLDKRPHIKPVLGNPFIPFHEMTEVSGAQTLDGETERVETHLCVCMCSHRLYILSVSR